LQFKKLPCISHEEICNVAKSQLNFPQFLLEVPNFLLQVPNFLYCSGRCNWPLANKNNPPITTLRTEQEVRKICLHWNIATFSLTAKHTNIFNFSAHSCFEIRKCDSKVKIPLSNKSQRPGTGVVKTISMWKQYRPYRLWLCWGILCFFGSSPCSKNIINPLSTSARQ
jgi:hypothetical protein